MGKRSAVESRPKGDPPPGQLIRQSSGIPVGHTEGQDPRLAGSSGPEDLDPGQFGQPLPCQILQGHLMAEEPLRSRSADEVHARQQTRRPRDVVGPGLQSVRQKVGHGLGPGVAPRPPFHQRLRRMSAEKQPRPLGPIYPLVSW